MRENEEDEGKYPRPWFEQVVMLLIREGYQVDAKVFDVLKNQVIEEDPSEIVKIVLEKIRGLPKPVLIITDEIIKEVLASSTSTRVETAKVETGKITFKPFAKEIKADLKVVEDPSNKLQSSGDIEYFIEYFRDRFSRMERLLRQRLDARDAISIAAVLESPSNLTVRTIGIVREKRETAKAIIIRIEDPESHATVIVSRRSPRETRQRAQNLLLDQVICVVGRSSRDRTIIASDIIVPDLPERRLRKATSPVMLALTSDLHIGSTTFLEKAFNRFLSWLEGKVGGERDRELSGRVKYLAIGGDLVDGIGVYPDQEKELKIPDIYEQYRKAGELIGKIPDYIEVIVIPGNHDAVRQALPQPALSKEFVELLSTSRRVLSLGNPSVVEIHGARVLLFHGRSLEDVIRAVPSLSYHQPQKAMEYLLRARHVAPTYGGSTPIAPEIQDHLIIEEPPEIFHSGHVHVNGYETYRGTVIVNSGSWQAQTDYQKRLGIMPTPGKVPIISLQDMHLAAELDFSLI